LSISMGTPSQAVWHPDTSVPVLNFRLIRAHSGDLWGIKAVGAVYFQRNRVYLSLFLM
jgi:hypothetical protein